MANQEPGTSVSLKCPDLRRIRILRSIFERDVLKIQEFRILTRNPRVLEMSSSQDNKDPEDHA